MLDSSMLPDFIIEAAEHLEELENSLLRLEQHKEEESREVMDALFRSVHTIKGAAQFVGIDRVAELSHKLENLLDLIRKGTQPLTELVIDLLIASKDRLAKLVEELESGQAEQSEVDDLLVRIKDIVEGKAPEAAGPPPESLPVQAAAEEPRPGSLTEESMTEEYDEELYNIFLQQLKENIPFLYAQTVELSLSSDKQDVLYRCSDSIKSLKSSANYMGYEKLARHYSNWQREISSAVEQLSSGRLPNLAFMQEYIDEIIRSFPQAMDGYSEEDADQPAKIGKERESASAALDSIFASGPPAAEAEQKEDPKTSANDLDLALDSIFAAGLPADDEEDEEKPGEGSPAAAAGPAARAAAAPVHEAAAPLPLEYELSEDEYDQELVTIFLKKLETDIHFLREQADELAAAPDKAAVLERCGDAVGRLASSANYMEYLKLAAFCEAWRQTVHEDIAILAEGLEPDAAGHLHFFIDEIVRVYPQITDGEQPQQPETKAPAEEAAATPQPLPAAEETLGAAGDEETEPPVPDDQELFAKLSTALEQSLSQDGAIADEEHHVIEKMIEKAEEPEEQNAADAVSVQAQAPQEPTAAEEPVPPPVVTAAPAAEPAAALEEPEQVPEEEASPRETADEEETEEGQQVRSTVKKPAVRSSIRVDADKIDYLMNQVGELVVSRAYFAQLVNEMRGLQQHLQENFKLSKSELKPLHEFAFRLNEAGVHLGRVSNELQEGVMKVRMLPIDQLFKRYPRLVRDLIHKTGKDVRLVTKGEETELDKMVIESISDPLIHIIRNAVDHGIETVEERKRAGKPGQAALFLEAFHESDHIVIEISDDGRGIDPKKIKAKALEKGFHIREELDRMSEQDLLRIIMEPGFSTAEKTTETSGRGVGMDVVKKNVERLNGTVEITSQVGRGTRLRVKIPLTMAIIQALMVRVGKEKFTIPLTTVEETLRIFRHDISEIEGVDVIHIRDITMPIFRLSRIYNIERAAQDEEKMFVVVVSTGTQEVGLVVDELLGQEEVVIKPLADYLRMESGFGGATILGDGGISLILDIPELVKIAAENQISRQAQRTLSFKRKRRRREAEDEQFQTVH